MGREEKEGAKALGSLLLPSLPRTLGPGPQEGFWPHPSLCVLRWLLKLALLSPPLLHKCLAPP